MEPTKETTISFSVEQHRRLSELAEREGLSLGEWVRHACELRYGLTEAADKVSAVEVLARLDLPVDTPEVMKRESQPIAGGGIPG